MKLYRAVFKSYFAIHDAFESRFFYTVCKLLKKPHPKNLFDYRSRVFLEHLSPEDCVADLGCGTGKLVLGMSPMVAQAVGVDLKPPLLLKNGFLQADILDPKLPALLLERGINTITLSHVLEHLEDPVDFLKRLKPFRKVLICVPSRENWRFQFKQSLGLDARTDPTHFREYSVEQLVTEIRDAGLSCKDPVYNSEGEIFAACGAVQ